MRIDDREHQGGQFGPESFGIPLSLLETPKDYDRELPYFVRTLTFLGQYRRATKPKAKESLTDQMSSLVIRDPKSIVHILNNFDLINQLNPQGDSREILNAFTQSSESAVARRSNLRQWTPEKIEQLVELGIEERGETKEEVLRLKRVLFNAPKLPEEAVDLFYNAAWAMVRTTHPQIREEIFSILCNEKGWLPTDAYSVFCFNAVQLSSDDNHIRRYHGILYALGQMGRFLETYGTIMPSSSVRFNQRTDRFVQAFFDNIAGDQSDPNLKKQQDFLFRAYTRNPQRIELFRNYLERKQEDPDAYVPEQIVYVNINNLEAIEAQKRKKEMVRFLRWPENLMEDPEEPLRKYVEMYLTPKIMRSIWDNYYQEKLSSGMQRLTERRIELGDDLELDILSREGLTAEQKNTVVREVVDVLLGLRPFDPTRHSTAGGGFDGMVEVAKYYTAVSGSFDVENKVIFIISRHLPEEDIGRLSSILEYSRPLITAEQRVNVENMISTLTEQIRTQFSRSIGKRGYTVLVSDPALREFGYKALTFIQKDEEGVGVRLDLGGQLFEFSLSEIYRVMEGEGDIKKFSTFQDKLWLELLTLSHLKKLICTDENQITAELFGKEKQYQFYRKQTIDKVEHIRRLPIGWRFSNEAYLRCLQSGLPIKRLDLINRLKAERGEGGTTETGLWTYVSPAEVVDLGVLPPVKLAFATASEDIRRVLSLSEVSEEELARIWNDMLDDL